MEHDGFNFLTVPIIKAPLSFPRPHLGVLSQRISEVFLDTREAGVPLEEKALMLFCPFHFCSLMAAPVYEFPTCPFSPHPLKAVVCLHPGAFKGGKGGS